MKNIARYLVVPFERKASYQELARRQFFKPFAIGEELGVVLSADIPVVFEMQASVLRERHEHRKPQSRPHKVIRQRILKGRSVEALVLKLDGMSEHGTDQEHAQEHKGNKIAGDECESETKKCRENPQFSDEDP